MGSASSKKTHSKVPPTQAQTLFIRLFSHSDSNLFEQIKAIPNWQELRVGRKAWTLLHMAVWTGDCPLVKQLLDEGIDPEIPDKNGETAIDLAKELHDSGIMDLLSPTEREGDKHTNSTLDAEFRPRKELVEIYQSFGKAGDLQKVRPIEIS